MFKKPIILTRKHSIAVLIIVVCILFLQSLTDLFLILIIFACYLITTLLLIDVWIVYGITKENIGKAFAEAGYESHTNYDIVSNTIHVTPGVSRIQYFSFKKLSIIIFHLPVKSPKIRFIRKFRSIIENP